MKSLFLTACTGMLLMSGAAFAQTCVSPLNLNANQGLTGQDTCSGTNIAGTLCGVASAPEKDIFYTVTLAAGYTATSIDLTNTAPAHVPAETYTPAMVLYTGACANGGPATGCTASAFAGAAGGNASLSLSGVPAGTYFLDVTSVPGNGAGDCGQYNLAFTGTLPVKLQKFSVN
jgi:hypothetical protein